jgi:uncharacterized protein involved in outer membrane biogenesis
MHAFSPAHPVSRRLGIGLVVLVCAIAVLLTFFDWNLLRPALARKISAETGRRASIDGDLKVHIWSWNPGAELNDITLLNPPWADRRLMFGARRLTFRVSLANLLRGRVVIPEIALIEPTLDLERDARGRASWELGTPAGTPNHNTQPAKIPVIRRLTIQGGKLRVADQIRKLTFSGSLTAADHAGAADAAAFQIRSQGSLNGKPFHLEANGGPLLNLQPDTPYTFATHLTAADITLDTHVTVAKPFDLGAMTVKFEVSGDDLANVFYLTGLALPNTPKYRLAATVHVDGTLLDIEGLQGRLGSSDISGHGHLDTAGKIPRLTATLSSKMLDIVDLAPTLGTPATDPARSLAGDTQSPSRPDPGTPAMHAAPAKVADSSKKQAGGRLLPDADLQVNRVRGMNADVTYHASAVTAPKVPMREVDFHLMLDNGLLTIDPLSFVMDAGKFSGRVQIDARPDVPQTDIDMRIDHVDLSEFKSAAMHDPPVEGDMQGRLQLHGAGSSIHKLGAGVDGNMSIVIPHGEIRAAFAELTGINVLSGLGLLLTKETDKTDIRCGILDFKAHDGSLDTTTVYVDTTNVLITGRGSINLGTEAIDLSLQGDPKKVRLLRLRSPIVLRGTLADPSVGINAGKLAEQVGEAVALGALLTPAASALAFIDPGLSKDKDCSTVFAQASAGVKN